MTEESLAGKYKACFEYLCDQYDIPYNYFTKNQLFIGIQTNGFKLTDKVCSVSTFLNLDDAVLRGPTTTFIKPRILKDEIEEDIYDKIKKLEETLADCIDFTVTCEKVVEGTPARTYGLELTDLLRYAEAKRLPVVSFSMFNFGWPRLKQNILPAKEWEDYDMCPNLFDLGMIEKMVIASATYDIPIDFPENVIDWYANIDRLGMRVSWSLHPVCTSRHNLLTPEDTKFQHKTDLYYRFLSRLLGYIDGESDTGQV